MILDLETTFSDDQDIGQVQAAYPSTNVYDLHHGGVAGNSPLPFGPGEPVKVNVKITEAVSGTSSTVLFELVSADAADMSGTVEVVKQTIAIPEATLVIGFQFTLTAPIEDFTERYMGMRYTIGTATTTLGKVYAGIVCHEQTADSDWTAVTGF